MSFCYNALKSSTFFNQIILENLERKGFQNLTPSLLAIFAHLAEAEPMSVSALANILGISRQAMHKSVNLLVRSGYVMLEMRPDNRKEKIVVLTDTGTSLIKYSLETISSTEQKMADFLGSEEYKIFIENQNKLTKYLEYICLDGNKTS